MMSSYLKKRNKKRHIILSSVILAIIIVTVLGSSIALNAMEVLLQSVPVWNLEMTSPNATTFIYDNKEELVAERHGEENRTLVNFAAIPSQLKQAFLAVEDKDFYQHNGISYTAIIRSLLANLRAGRTVQGASTITLQLVKNTYTDVEERQSKEMERKVTEALIALDLEKKYNKDQIFEQYLNIIPFGSGAYGVEAAAKTFFGKSVGKLTLPEAALLAGLTQRPTAYNPFRNPEAALERRNVVLSKMYKYEYITEAAYNAAITAPLGVQSANEETEQTAEEEDTSAFLDAVLSEAENVLTDLGYSERSLYTGGYKIYTTLDQEVQSRVDEIYADDSYFPKDQNGKNVESAMALLDHTNGEVIAMAGGRNYTVNRGYNRATQLIRSPGSTIKPLVVYGPAVAQGLSPNTIVDDVPFVKGSYKPSNYDGKYRGPVTMRTAISLSLNMPALRLFEIVGINNGFEFGKKMTLPLVDSDANISLALGGVTYGFSPLEMARAYGIYANRGVLKPSYLIRKITDAEGNILYQANNQPQRIVSENTAYVISDMLKTVVTSGTGKKAQISGWDVAGKTGTVQLPAQMKDRRGNADAWFIGYTAKYTAAVWMGFDKTSEGSYLRSVYGGDMPAKIWKNVVVFASKDLEPQRFTAPANLNWGKTEDFHVVTPEELAAEAAAKAAAEAKAAADAKAAAENDAPPVEEKTPEEDKILTDVLVP